MREISLVSYQIVFLRILELLKGDSGGMAIDRYEHCLQCATRAFRDGRDEEYVVCALLHDIGDSIASTNHADLAATMLEPFVSEKSLDCKKSWNLPGILFF